MKKENWIWMPHAGHFICGRDCIFHLTTYVGGYIVSTIGEFWPDSRIREINAQVCGKTIKGRGDEWDANYFKEFGWEELGPGRTYETMVFKAKRAPSEEICCPWRMDCGSEQDFAGYNDANAATAGHMAMCAKWSKQ